MHTCRFDGFRFTREVRSLSTSVIRFALLTLRPLYHRLLTRKENLKDTDEICCYLTKTKHDKGLYTHAHTHTRIYIYIYIEREREREKESFQLFAIRFLIPFKITTMTQELQYSSSHVPNTRYSECSFHNLNFTNQVYHCCWDDVPSTALKSCYFSKYNAIHRPQKVYEHQHQRKIRGKYQIWRAISQKPNIVHVGCWNLDDFVSHGPYKEQHMVNKKNKKIPINHYIYHSIISFQCQSGL